MMGWLAIGILAALAAIGYRLGRARIRHWRADSEIPQRLHSVPGYYAAYLALLASLPALFIALLWVFGGELLVQWYISGQLPTSLVNHPFYADLLHREVVDERLLLEIPELPEARAAYHQARDWLAIIALNLMALVGLAGLALGLRRIHPQFPARNKVDRLAHGLLIFSAGFSILITFAIVGSVLFEAIRFFQYVSPGEFFLGMHWSPQSAAEGDIDKFGAIPLFLGTGLIMLVAMLVAVPLGLMSAIYMAEYASPGFRNTAKPALEILAGIPTVVYGYFAITIIAPALRGVGEQIGISVASESALAAGLTMGIMIVPFISSLADDIITAVPYRLREAAYGLGATKSETIKQVILPAALPGIAGAVLLAISRAIGETMIVVMAAGLAANITFNPLESVTTVTAQIVALLTGDQEFDSPKTLAAFALGLTLFAVTLVLNIIALRVVKHFREAYD